LQSIYRPTRFQIVLRKQRDIGERHVWRNIYITNVVRNFLNSVKGLKKPRADTVDG